MKLVKPRGDVTQWQHRREEEDIADKHQSATMKGEEGMSSSLWTNITVKAEGQKDTQGKVSTHRGAEC